MDEHAWAIVIGAVCGTGPATAARTSAARYSMRACAVQHRSPSDALRYTNLALDTHNNDSERLFITAIIARVDSHPDRTVIHLGSAGHPLLLLLRRSGEVHIIGEPGHLLGVTARHPESATRQSNSTPQTPSSSTPTDSPTPANHNASMITACTVCSPHATA